jgi:HlyD family secretion protein
LNIPNSALRFRPPDAAMLPANTNAPATQTAQNTNGAVRRGGTYGQGGGQGRRGGGRTRGERPIVHTVYVLSGDGKNPTLKPVQIKTGISDGISTEVLSGLNEGDRVVTGTVSTSSAIPASTSNPFGGGGGGFPRGR